MCYILHITRLKKGWEMSESINFGNHETEKDALKNIADFFYESITNFKRTLSDLTVSINHFLSSLHSIEKHLGVHGFEHPQTASELLYERLAKDKQKREKEQQDLIARLTHKEVSPLTTVKSPQSVHVKPVIQVKPTPPPSPIKPIESTKPKPTIMKEEMPIEAIKSEVIAGQKVQYISPNALKEEILNSLRILKKHIKNYK